MIAEHTQPAKAVSKGKSPAPTQKHLEEDSAPQYTVLPIDNPATSTKSGSSKKVCLSVAQCDRVDMVFAGHPRRDRAQKEACGGPDEVTPCLGGPNQLTASCQAGR